MSPETTGAPHAHEQPTNQGLTTRDTERLTRTLTELPTLMAELVAIGETPAIHQETETRRPIPGSRPPVNLNRLTLLSGSESALSILTAWTRHAMTEARAADVDLPDMTEHATVATECTWLLATRFYLIHQPWAPTMVGDLATLHGRIRQALNYRPEIRYICPECADTMRLQPGDQWFQCDSGHVIEATYDPAIRREPAQSTSEICQRFNITPNDLANWRRRGKLTPHKPGGTGSHEQAMWFPWDVFLIQRPDIAQAIHERETRKAG